MCLCSVLNLDLFCATSGGSKTRITGGGGYTWIYSFYSLTPFLRYDFRAFSAGKLYCPDIHDAGVLTRSKTPINVNHTTRSKMEEPTWTAAAGVREDVVYRGAADAQKIKNKNYKSGFRQTMARSHRLQGNLCAMTFMCTFSWRHCFYLMHGNLHFAWQFRSFTRQL